MTNLQPFFAGSGRAVVAAAALCILAACAPLPGAPGPYEGPMTPTGPTGPVGAPGVPRPGGPVAGPPVAPPGPPLAPGTRAIAVVGPVEGPNAFLDVGNTGVGRRVAPGQPVAAGDRFFTGAGTRMRIDFASGGSVELDENTDPSLFEDLGCLVVSLFRSGRIFVDKSAACVESINTKSQQFSKVVYEVMPPGPATGAYVQITVVEGRAETLRPVRAAVPTGWRMDLDGRRVLRAPYALPPAEVQRAWMWTMAWRSQAPAPRAQPGGPWFGLPPIIVGPRRGGRGGDTQKPPPVGTPTPGSSGGTGSTGSTGTTGTTGGSGSGGGATRVPRSTIPTAPITRDPPPPSSSGPVVR